MSGNVSRSGTRANSEIKIIHPHHPPRQSFSAENITMETVLAVRPDIELETFREQQRESFMNMGFGPMTTES